MQDEEGNPLRVRSGGRKGLHFGLVGLIGLVGKNTSWLWFWLNLCILLSMFFFEYPDPRLRLLSYEADDRAFKDVDFRDT